jgi:hypothetical protein
MRATGLRARNCDRLTPDASGLTTFTHSPGAPEEESRPTAVALSSVRPTDEPSALPRGREGTDYLVIAAWLFAALFGPAIVSLLVLVVIWVT